MERRKFITVLSSMVPLSMAGCMGGQNDGGSGTTAAPTTDEPAGTTAEPTTTTTTTPEDDGPLSVGDRVELSDDRGISVARIESSVVVLTQADGGADVKGEKGGYYVLVSFDGNGISEYESFVRENVSVVIEGEEYGDPVFTYASGFNTFTAAYQVPADIVPYTGSVRLDTGDLSAIWEFDGGVIDAITRKVDYSVSSLSVPDSVAPESPFSIEFTVENGGDPMTFLAQVFGTLEAPLRIREDVPESDAKTVTVAAKAPAAGDADEFDVTLDWGADSTTETIPFE
ncbi:MAG: hypothetical protein ACI9YT_001583 [Halobacteriales archaeon]|jgi:hypothetical protein